MLASLTRQTRAYIVCKALNLTPVTVRRMTASAEGKIKLAITSKLQSRFSPLHLEVVNESFKHNVPKGSETHFKVTIVAADFEGKTLIEQHRLVNELLKEELSQGVHALSIKTSNPAKWQATNSSIAHETPNCMGGSKK